MFSRNRAGGLLLALLAMIVATPALAQLNPALSAVRNPSFGRARATLPGREIQLGLRWIF